MALLELKTLNQKNKQSLQLGSKYDILSTEVYLNFAPKLSTYENKRKLSYKI